MRAASVILSFFLCIAIFSCSSKLISTTETRISLGTYVQIIVVSPKNDVENVRIIIDNAYDKITELEKNFDYRAHEGALAAFNDSQSLSRQDNTLLFSILETSLAIAAMTDGYFDPTILPLVELWGFGEGNPKLPRDEEINRSLTFVGFDKVRVSDNRIIKPMEVKFDLSGIAKGKIVDLIRDYFREAGYNNFLINAGGDIYVSGKTKEKEKWRIAIQDPIHENRYSGIVEKSNMAIVTSGDYEQFFVVDGVRYSHLFNPKTGYPFSDLHSVTIIADDTIVADGIATAIFSMGSDEGFSFLNRHSIEGFLIYSSKSGEIDSRSTSHFWD